MAVRLIPGTGERFAPGETVELRPGLSLPDWSLLTDPQGRAALAASMAVAGRREKWSGLGAAEDAVRRAVLRHFAAHGRAPASSDLLGATGIGETELLQVLRSLQRRDLLVLDTAGAVTAAYPFSAAPTQHRVALDGTKAQLHALCAIDALGMGGMLRTGTLIGSLCAQCGAGVAVRTCSNGRAMAAVVPAEAVVWSGIRYAGGCAATSGCAIKLFFCSDAHLEAWRAERDPDGAGFRLTMAAALQVGLALFVPMLAPDTA